MDKVGWDRPVGNGGQAPSVLVVEDEALVSAMVGDELTERGFEVRIAANGKDALTQLAGGVWFDVLFTDINLPGDIDGVALARLARRLRPGLPVVYASGRVGGVDEIDAVDGAVFVPKPYDPETVCALLRRSIVTGRQA